MMGQHFRQHRAVGLGHQRLGDSCMSSPPRRWCHQVVGRTSKKGMAEFVASRCICSRAQDLRFDQLLEEVDRLIGLVLEHPFEELTGEGGPETCGELYDPPSVRQAVQPL